MTLNTHEEKIKKYKISRAFKRGWKRSSKACLLFKCRTVPSTNCFSKCGSLMWICSDALFSEKRTEWIERQLSSEGIKKRIRREESEEEGDGGKVRGVEGGWQRCSHPAVHCRLSITVSLLCTAFIIDFPAVRLSSPSFSSSFPLPSSFSPPCLFSLLHLGPSHLFPLSHCTPLHYTSL